MSPARLAPALVPGGGPGLVRPARGAAYFAVGNRKMRFGKPTSEQQAAGLRADRSVLHCSDQITLRVTVSLETMQRR